MQTNYSLFPTIYSDESFYSICARFHLLNCNKTADKTIEQLFGSTLVNMNLDFPHHLERFCSRIPHKSGIDVDRMLFQHTLIPLYIPFMEQKDHQESVVAMKSNEKQSVLYCSGIIQSRIPLNKYLKVCPQCFQSDDHTYGEPYWHRSHQVFGVNICPIHHIPLHNTSISTEISFHLSSDLLVSLSEKVLDQSTPIEVSKTHLSYTIKLSNMVFKLLNRPFCMINSEPLSDQYIRALKLKQLVSTNGTIKKKELMERLTSYFGEAFLEGLHCTIKSYRSNWIDRLLHPRTNMHPLYHLLFIQFLGLDYEEIIGGNLEEEKPFGKGPWICLNGALKHHYGKRVVTSCKTERATNGAVLGTFTCSCGFCYTRRGPDQTQLDRDRIGSIVSYGPLWLDKLHTLKYQEKLNQNQIAKILRVSPVTVGRKLNEADYRDKHSSNKPVSMNCLNEYREALLLVIKNNPEFNQSEIREHAKREYIWLYRHDKDWLRSIMPKRRRKSDGGANVDWNERDRVLSKKVQVAVQKLQMIGVYKRPERITLKSIARHLENHDILRYDSVKLPLTFKAINDVMETKDDYRLRRIYWATLFLRDKGVSLTASKVRKKASIQYKDLNDLLIKEIHECLMKN